MWRENTRFATLCIYDDTFIGGERGEPALLVHRTRSMKSSRSVSIFLSLRRPLCLATRNDNAYVITRDFTLLFSTRRFLCFLFRVFCSFSSRGGKKITDARIEKRALLLEQQLANKRRSRSKERRIKKTERQRRITNGFPCVCVCVCVCVCLIEVNEEQKKKKKFY
jgi:hypothetical protein